MPTSVTDWHARARSLAIQSQAYIDGRYVPAASGETFDCISPIDGRLLARVASTDVADADLAVAAARRAFDGGTHCAGAAQRAGQYRWLQDPLH